MMVFLEKIIIILSFLVNYLFFANVPGHIYGDIRHGEKCLQA